MVKVTLEDYKMLNEFKRMQTELAAIQRRFEQAQGIKRNDIQVVCKEREIEFKEGEIKSGDIIEKHIEFTDDKKPIFLIKNEIDVLKQQIEELKETNKLIKEKMEEDIHGRNKANTGDENKNPLAQ